MNNAKYEVGQRVCCAVQNAEDDVRCVWVGVIQRVSNVGEDDPMWEYEVSNAPVIAPGRPLLAWEPEVTLIPPDPENLNDSRASWAQHAIDKFDALVNNEAGIEPRHHVVADLVADLHHWCDRNGVDFDGVLNTANVHYTEETRPS